MRIKILSEQKTHTEGGYMFQCDCKSHRVLRKGLAIVGGVAVLVATLFIAPSAQAAVLTGADVTLSAAATSDASISYTFDVDGVSLSAIKCMKLTFSDTVGGSTLPTGMSIAAAAYSAANSDYVPDVQTWTAATSGSSVSVTNATGETPASATGRTIQLTGITNGSTAGTTYYVELNTYTDTACTAGVDTDGIATFAFVAPVDVTGTVNPGMTFTVSSSSCSLGTLQAGSTGSCTYTIAAATNGTNGYTLSYDPNDAAANRAVLTSNVDTNDTITAIGGTAAASSTGSEQFGINVKDNATPNVGAEATQTAGTGTPAANYNTADSFAYNSTTAANIATSSAPANTTYTVSNIANISQVTEAGIYSMELVYNLVASF